MCDDEKNDGTVIKIMTIEDSERNPMWGGIAHILSAIGTVLFLLGLALSAKMCNSDIETISRAWHGQIECSKQESENER